MALILRPIKQFGFRTYTDDFNAAPLNPSPPPTNVYVIQTAEVDGDLDTVYALVNGGLDNANIAPGAGIVYGKLDLTDSIVDADVNTAAAIKGSKLADAPNGITTTKINDLAVTLGKLAIGAGFAAGNTFKDEVPAAITSTETVVGEFTYTARGGIGFYLWSIGGLGTDSTLGGAQQDLTIRVREQGTPATADGSILTTQVLTLKGVPTNAITFPFSATAFGTEQKAGGTTVRLKLTVEQTAGGGGYNRNWVYGMGIELP